MQTRCTSDKIYLQLRCRTSARIIKVSHPQFGKSICSLLSLQYQIKMGKRLIESIPLKYCKIDFEKRVELIEAVLVNKESIINASKNLGIKFSTAKLIIKRYKENGYIFEKKGGQQVRKQAKGDKDGGSDIKRQEEEIVPSNGGTDYCNPNSKPIEGLVCPPFPLYTYYYFDPFGSFLPNFGAFS